MKQKDINIDLSYHHLKLQDHNKDMSLDQRLKKLANLKNKHS